MRVTHVIFNLYTGGTELMLTDIIASQARQGADVSLLVINRGHDEAVLARIPEGVNVIFLNRKIGSKNPLWYWRFNRALRDTKPDVVHYHNDKSVGMTIKRPGTLYVGTVHAPQSPLKYYKRLDHIFAISQGVRTDIMTRYGYETTVVYNGIDTARISTRDHRREGALRIVQVGRLRHEVKGQDLLIKAIAQVPEATADIVGDGESMGYLRQLIADLNLHDRVRLLGMRDRDWVYNHLKDYDLYVQPSRLEGFGLTVAEAMAAKVPVLVSALDGPMEVIGETPHNPAEQAHESSGSSDQGSTIAPTTGHEPTYGSAFTPDDVDNLANKIQAISDDYPRYEAIAAGPAYDRVTSIFSIATTAAEYLRRYSELKSAITEDR